MKCRYSLINKSGKTAPDLLIAVVHILSIGTKKYNMSHAIIMTYYLA